MAVFRFAAGATFLLALAQPTSSAAVRTVCTGSYGERALASAQFVRENVRIVDIDQTMQNFADVTGSKIDRYRVFEPGQSKSKAEFHLIRSDRAIEIEVVAAVDSRGLSVKVSRTCNSNTSQGWEQYWRKFTSHLLRKGFQKPAV